MQSKRRTSFHIPKEHEAPTIQIELPADNERVIDKRALSSRVEVECFNYTGHMVKTFDHMGSCIIHKPLTTNAHREEFVGCFVMRRTVEIHDETQIVSVGNYLKDHRYSVADNMDAEQYSNNVASGVNRSRGLTRRSMTHYIRVKYQDLVNNGGSVYVRVTDLVLTSEDHKGNIIHPNSKEYIDMRIEQLYDASHTYSIEINDPNNLSDIYYINLNGKVFQINPTRNEWIADGARITFKPPHQPMQTVHHSSLNEDDLKNIGIFKNYSDADQYDKKLELRLAELKNESALTKAESETVTARNKLIVDDLTTENKFKELMAKMELLQAQTEAERQKFANERQKFDRDIEYEREKHLRAMQDLQTKDFYDNRSYERKDSSEFIKFVPVILGGVLASIALLNK